MGMRWLAWQGLAWQGLAWQGLAWQGLAWQGLAWQGLAWQGLAVSGAEMVHLRVVEETGNQRAFDREFPEPLMTRVNHKQFQ
jgi:hypothetical protein